MSKPEWGQKRTCTSCGCRFYDLGRSPIICPKCKATVEPDAPAKVRRSHAAVEPKAPVPVPAAIAEPDELAGAEDDEEALADGEEAVEDALIEDASDLGEDDDDMAEVMEHMDEELADEV